MVSTSLPFAFSDCEDEVSEGTIKLPGENGLFGLGEEAFVEALGTSYDPVPPSDITPAEISRVGSENSFASSVTAPGSVEDTSGLGNLNSFSYSDSFSFHDISVTGLSEDQFNAAYASSQDSPSFDPAPQVSASFEPASQVSPDFDPASPISVEFEPISQSSQVSQLPADCTTVETLPTFTHPFPDWPFESEEAVNVGATLYSPIAQNPPTYSDLSDTTPSISYTSSVRPLWHGGVRSRGITRPRRQSRFNHMISGPSSKLGTTPACLLCNLAFHNPGELKNHRRKYHPKPKLYSCYDPLCTTRFSAKCNLSKHFKSVHEKIRPYYCDEESCMSTFSERNKLKKHRDTVHRGERPFVCEYVECAKPFGQKSDRTRHVSVVHLQERKYKCGECVKSFGRKSSLTQHVIRIHKVNKDTARIIMTTAIGDDAEGSEGVTVYPRKH